MMAAMASQSCAFCRIAAGDAPAAIVFADDGFVGFLDVRPVFPGHVLVVPRAHHPTLADLPAELVGPLFARVQAVSAAVPVAVEAAGTFVAVNNVVSQSVPHLHVHVVPRRPKDGLRGFFWPRVVYDDDAHRDGVAAAIRSALSAGGAPAWEGEGQGA